MVVHESSRKKNEKLRNLGTKAYIVNTVICFCRILTRRNQFPDTYLSDNRKIKNKNKNKNKNMNKNHN